MSWMIVSLFFDSDITVRLALVEALHEIVRVFQVLYLLRIVVG